jgi:hypothetical protein
MNPDRPGLDPRRLVRLMQEAIERCRLVLDGATVLTEAATGAYVVTPVLAAMAGAERVIAVTRASKYGSVEQVENNTRELANIARVGDRLEIVEHKTKEAVSRADIITNSGYVRPIDAQMISWMKPNAVLPLMYEAWEFRPDDVDLEACRQRGIKVGGTNECHPAVDVFSFLGIMAVKLLADAGIAAYGSSVLLLCDNPFSSFIDGGLVGAGARVHTYQSLSRVTEEVPYDAIVVALRPRYEPVLSAGDAVTIGDRWPGTVVAQFWGDVDRNGLLAARVPVWPLQPPAQGHMGILPSDVGPEPIVRLQSGGLKVAELLLTSCPEIKQRDSEFVQVVDMEDVNG